MEQDRGLWFPTQPLSSLYHLGKQKLNVFSSQPQFDGSNDWIHESLLPPQTNKIPIRNQVDNAKSQCLVFDQSRDKTTLLIMKQPNMNEEHGDSEVGMESEMQEDTEELNALLYSEDESVYCSDEDEVTSIVSSAHGQSHSRKRKGESYDSILNAESSCGSCGNIGIGFVKRSKAFGNKIGEEKILETVSLLRSIVPGDEEKDPILVIDRAIDYLKSLKMEAEILEEKGTLSLKDI